MYQRVLARWLRVLLGAVLGYLVVAGSLTLIVMTWWINEWLPLGPLWIAAIVGALILSGWLAGSCARRVSGGAGRPALYAAAAITVIVTTANIVLGVAAEPLWFKVLVLTVLVPSLFVAGLRTGSARASGASREPTR